MRRDARASRRVADIGALLVLVACCICAFSASPALAGTIANDRPFLFSFDGSDTTAGAFTRLEGGIDIDNSGDVYVINVAGSGKGPGPYDSQRVVDKFNALGQAQNFSATGKSSLDGSATPGGAFGVLGFFGQGAQVTDVAVDNSAVNPGRIYVSEATGPIHAFNPDGTYLWDLPGSTVDPCGLAVDAQGHLWVVDTSKGQALEFASSGSPPAQIGSPISLTAGNHPCRPGIDQSGNNLYVSDVGGNSTSLGIEKYVSGTHDSTLTNKTMWEIAVDQSSPTGHVFGIHSPLSASGEGFSEFDSTGTEVSGGPFGSQVIGDGRGIAYNPVKDWVYVADVATNTVKVFGPPTSGTVPDVTTNPTTAVGRSTATANATINPQNVNNSYHFEWAAGGDEVQHLRVNASSGSFEIGAGGASPVYTDPLPFDASPASIQSALENLAPIGTGNVTVAGTPAQVTDPTDNAGYIPGEYDITFVGALTGRDVDQLSTVSIKMEGISSPGATITTSAQGPNWATAQSSPAQSIAPTDNAAHDLTLPLTGLDQNAPYSVRLVATNTDNSLSAYARPDAFKTLAPPLPAVTIDSISPITTSSAHVAATIDPQEDRTKWKVQKSAGPSCASGLVDEPTQTISTPPPGAVPVTWDLTGLLPAQTYCVRVTATNGGGTTTADQVIQTDAIAPSDLETVFAAPRTDTTARINGRINPQGEADVTYHFETSTDAVNWVARPDLVSTANARTPIVLSDQLSGLNPDTTYYYRLESASNSAGSAAGPGAAKSFTTRSTPSSPSCLNADVRAAQHTTYLGDCRGIELVNNPDKGNQNAVALGPGNGASGRSPASEDGNKVLWSVAGGAPGAPNGTLSNFLATRTPTGWHSESVAPPAEQQVGGGDLLYSLNYATPDFNTFLFAARLSSGFAAPPAPTIVRVRNGKQDVLKAYTGQPINSIYEGSFDVSDDGAHVLFMDFQTKQLEDIGNPGKPVTISIMPNGSPAPCGLDVGGGNSFGGLRGPQMHPGDHWIATADASRVYFRAQVPGPPSFTCGSGPYGLYVRNRAANGGKGATTLIDPGFFGSSPAFIGASADGKQTYFVTESNNATYSGLDAADTNAGADIYRWDESSGQSTCLTCVVAGGGQLTENPLGMMASRDFSHFYFLSQAQLVAGQGTQGEFNLYVLNGGQVRFVAIVDGDVLTRGAFPQLSADGNVLLFRAKATPGLTSDAIAAQCIDPRNENPGNCTELYRYDDRDSSLECLSCDHAGLTSHGLGSLGGPEATNFNLSADGSTTAFVTQQTLLPADVNRDTDIYEWRDGVLHLITDGVSHFQSGLSTAPMALAVDGDGSNILFGIVPPGGSLTGYERDGLFNLYDARVAGGFPPPSSPTHCVEDSCQGPLQPAPALDRPGSSTLVGPVNPPARFKQQRKHRKHKHRKHRGHRKFHRHNARRAGR